MITLRIHEIAFGGDGIGFHEGKVCFVPGTLPGERIEAEILQEKKDFLRLKIVRILESSPQRVSAPCVVYGRCGGCQYQHASYLEELHIKEQQVRTVLKKFAGIENAISPILYSDKDYGYRNSVTFHLAQEKKNKPQSFFFIANDNVSEIPVQNCDLLNDSLKKVFDRRHRVVSNAKKITFKLDENRKIISDQQEQFFRVHMLGTPLVTHSKGFFQNNLAVTKLICQKILRWVETARPDVFYDLYAGVGTFSLVCAKAVNKIVCVEENPYAVLALGMNRQEQGLKTMTIHESRVEDIFQSLWQKETSKNAMLLMDPPRRGLERKFCDFIATHCHAKTMVYLSCDIATLARDLKIFLSQGRWAVREIVPFDMFPRTKHIEAAVLLSAL